MNTWTVQLSNRKSKSLPAKKKLEERLGRYLVALIRNLGPFIHVESAREAVAKIVTEHGRGLADRTWFCIVGYEDFDGRKMTYPARLEDTARGPLVDR